MEIRYINAQHEELVQSVNEKLDGIDKLIYILRGCLTSIFAMSLFVFIPLTIFRVGNSWIGIVVFGALTFGAYYGIGKLKAPVTPGMQAIFEERYTVDRTTCEDIWSERRGSRDSVSTWFFKPEGHEPITDDHLLGWKKGMLTRYIKKGDMIDVIETAGEKFVIKAMI